MGEKVVVDEAAGVTGVVDIATDIAGDMPYSPVRALRGADGIRRSAPPQAGVYDGFPRLAH